MVLIPVKAFADAKVRLASVLTAPERLELAQRMADRVVAAAAPLPVAVVCDDPGVRAWAEGHGARVIWRPGRGLNGAVTEGVASLAADGFDRVVVAHADLPLATHLAWVADFEGVTLVPDRHDDGTNVAGVPAGAGFRFAYGQGSFERHRLEAERLGLSVRVVRDAALGWDVDLPTDLDFEPPLETPCP